MKKRRRIEADRNTKDGSAITEGSKEWSEWRSRSVEKGRKGQVYDGNRAAGLL